MRKKSLVRLFLVVSIAATVMAGVILSTGCGTAMPGSESIQAPGSAPGEKVLRFGDISAYSGLAANWGLQLAAAQEIAAEDINADGGILVGGEYYKLELVQYDSEFIPTVANTVARKAVHDDGLRYFSVLVNDPIYAVTDILEAEDCVWLGAANLAGELGAERPGLFQVYYNNIIQYEYSIDVFWEQNPGFDTAAYVSNDGAMGRQVTKEWTDMMDAKGVNYIEPVMFAQGSTDYYSLVTALLDKEPDYIQCGANATQDNAHIMKQARELGYEGPFGVHELDAEYYELVGNEDFEGTIGAAANYDVLSEVGKKAGDRYIEKVGHLITWTLLAGYDGLLTVAAAIEKADTFDTIEVKKAMEEVRVEGIFGESYYVENRFSEGLVRYLQTKLYFGQVHNGEPVQVFFGYPEDFGY